MHHVIQIRFKTSCSTCMDSTVISTVWLVSEMLGQAVYSQPTMSMLLSIGTMQIA